MLNFVLFGPPGSGKGTQSVKLADKYNLIHISTGDLLRAEIAAGTTLGLEAKPLMDHGTLVPDEIVFGMLSNKIEANSNANGFIFDGFPRTTSQAVALDHLLESKHTEVTATLALDVSDEELTKRLLLRGKESGRADDQNEEIIRNRIKEYNNKTFPLKIYYQSQSRFHDVNGIGSVEEIFENLADKINALKANSAQSAYESHNIAESSYHTNGESHDDMDVMVEERIATIKDVAKKKVLSSKSKVLSTKSKVNLPAGKAGKKIKKVSKKKTTAKKKKVLSTKSKVNLPASKAGKKIKKVSKKKSAPKKKTSQKKK